MFIKAIHPDTLLGIRQLNQVSFINSTYLAGGTALALQIGHRVSVDLDFFTPIDFDEKEVAPQFQKLPIFKDLSLTYKTVFGRLSETKFSLFYYKYDVLGAFEKFEGINVLSKKDIAVMKLHAIEDRGTKRDFIDLFFLLREFSLDQVLDFYDQKYKCLESHLFPLIKSLNYFADAEHDEWEPQMLVAFDWEEIKKLNY